MMNLQVQSNLSLTGLESGLSRLFNRGWKAETVSQPNISRRIFKFRGSAITLQSDHSRECIISGPSETGKTIAALYKLDTLARNYKDARGAIVRKVHKDMAATVLDVFKKYILADDVRVFGGEHPEFYEWPTGTRVFVGGMDRPGRVLSGQLDFAYVNQAEELTLPDWETLSTRTTGRAGVIVPGLLFGDCNPSQANHWILDRAKSGALTMLESKHEDNPALYDNAGLTEQGHNTMQSLDALTGVRLLRLRKGQWVNAEGAIYEFNPAVHMIDKLPFDLSEAKTRFRVVDFGFTNPFCCGFFAEDNDGRLYLYRQIYMTGRTVKAHSETIKRFDERISATVCDHDAEDRATLAENGIPTIAAQKAVTVGIEKVQERLKIAQDGKPRLFIVRGSLVELDPILSQNKKPCRVEDEFGNYRWKDNAKKDEPVKEDDHGMDMIRYGVMYRDAGNTTWVRKAKTE